MTTATSLQPGTLLLQREAYLSILKDLTIMDDIFMRNVLKDSACTEYILKVIMDQDNLKLERPDPSGGLQKSSRTFFHT